MIWIQFVQLPLKFELSFRLKGFMYKKNNIKRESSPVYFTFWSRQNLNVSILAVDCRNSGASTFSGKINFPKKPLKNESWQIIEKSPGSKLKGIKNPFFYLVKCLDALLNF